MVTKPLLELMNFSIVRRNNMDKIRGILEIALNFEKSGRNFYKENLEKVNQKVAKDVFNYLMDMEASHVTYIQKLIREREEGSSISWPQDATDADSIFEKRLKSQALSNSTYSSDLADLSIIRMAYLIEKDFAEYYDNASKEIEDQSTKNMLIALRDWEKKHAEILKSLIEKIFEKHSLDLGFYG